MAAEAIDLAAPPTFGWTMSTGVKKIAAAISSAHLSSVSILRKLYCVSLPNGLTWSQAEAILSRRALSSLRSVKISLLRLEEFLIGSGIASYHPIGARPSLFLTYAESRSYSPEFLHNSCIKICARGHAISFVVLPNARLDAIDPLFVDSFVSSIQRRFSDACRKFESRYARRAWRRRRRQFAYESIRQPARFRFHRRRSPVHVAAAVEAAVASYEEVGHEDPAAVSHVREDDVVVLPGFHEDDMDCVENLKHLLAYGRKFVPTPPRADLLMRASAAAALLSTRDSVPVDVSLPAILNGFSSDNLTIAARESLRALRSLADVAVPVPADRGSSTFLMPREKYVSSVLETVRVAISKGLARRVPATEALERLEQACLQLRQAGFKLREDYVPVIPPVAGRVKAARVGAAGHDAPVPMRVTVDMSDSPSASHPDDVAVFLESLAGLDPLVSRRGGTAIALLLRRRWPLRTRMMKVDAEVAFWSLRLDVVWEMVKRAARMFNLPLPASIEAAAAATGRDAWGIFYDVLSACYTENVARLPNNTTVAFSGLPMGGKLSCALCKITLAQVLREAGADRCGLLHASIFVDDGVMIGTETDLGFFAARLAAISRSYGISWSTPEFARPGSVFRILDVAVEVQDVVARSAAQRGTFFTTSVASRNDRFVPPDFTSFQCTTVKLASVRAHAFQALRICSSPEGLLRALRIIGRKAALQGVPLNSMAETIRKTWRKTASLCTSRMGAPAIQGDAFIPLPQPRYVGRRRGPDDERWRKIPYAGCARARWRIAEMVPSIFKIRVAWEHQPTIGDSISALLKSFCRIPTDALRCRGLVYQINGVTAEGEGVCGIGQVGERQLLYRVREHQALHDRGRGAYAPEIDWDFVNVKLRYKVPLYYGEYARQLVEAILIRVAGDTCVTEPDVALPLAVEALLPRVFSALREAPAEVAPVVSDSELEEDEA